MEQHELDSRLKHLQGAVDRVVQLLKSTGTAEAYEAAAELDDAFDRLRRTLKP